LKPESDYYAMSRIKVFRKKTVKDKEEIVKYADAYFSKLHQVIKDNIDNFNPLPFDIKSKL
jgi:hypothetical protein